MRGQVRNDLAEDGGEVDGFPPGGKLPLAGLRQQQELRDELFQPRRLLDGALGR